MIIKKYIVIILISLMTILSYGYSYDYTSNSCITTTLRPYYEWIFIEDSWKLFIRDVEWNEIPVELLDRLDKVFWNYFLGDNEKIIKDILSVQKILSTKLSLLSEESYWEQTWHYPPIKNQKAYEKLKAYSTLSLFLNSKLLDHWFEKQHYTETNRNLCTNNNK